MYYYDFGLPNPALQACSPQYLRMPPLPPLSTSPAQKPRMRRTHSLPRSALRPLSIHLHKAKQSQPISCLYEETRPSTNPTHVSSPAPRTRSRVLNQSPILRTQRSVLLACPQRRCSLYRIRAAERGTFCWLREHFEPTSGLGDIDSEASWRHMETGYDSKIASWSTLPLSPFPLASINEAQIQCSCCQMEHRLLAQGALRANLVAERY